jgi:hypothetical protein
LGVLRLWVLRQAWPPMSLAKPDATPTGGEDGERASPLAGGRLGREDGGGGEQPRVADTF